MPYTVKKCKCKNSKGKRGKYIVTKKGKSKQLSCHTSKAKAKSAIRARYIQENYAFIVERVFTAILNESIQDKNADVGSYHYESYKYGWPEFEEKEFDKTGKTTWHEDREWTKQYLKSIGLLKWSQIFY